MRPLAVRRSSFSLFSKFIWTIAFALTFCLPALSPKALAQNFQVLHAFTDGLDGDNPFAGVTVDRHGNVYGTTAYGGTSNQGTVFKLAQGGSGWIFTPLYSFSGSNEGQVALAPLTVGPDGTLYGTTSFGGTSGLGTVFNVRPPANLCRSFLCFWTGTVLHTFTGGSDGSEPGNGAVVFDQAGNLYGTTVSGGSTNGGVLYELTHSQNGWTENIAYNMSAGTTGIMPYGGVIFDSAGNLYGTAVEGGGGSGAVYELMPSGSGFTGRSIYAFPPGQPDDGSSPYGGVILDTAGNLYGVAFYGGPNGAGVVYQLSPSGGGWIENVLFAFGENNSGPAHGYPLAMDSEGNLYGTTFQGGTSQHGNVFRLSSSNGQWVFTDLHDFTGRADGGFPLGGVAIDASGNLYGTTEIGGSFGGNCSDLGCGVVWEITP